MIQVNLLGHTFHTLGLHPSGIGEMANTQVVSRYLEESPYRLGGPWDAYELSGLTSDRKQLLTLPGSHFLKNFSSRIDLDAPWVQLLLVNPYVLTALQRFGVPHLGPTITRIYAHDDFSPVDPHLHLESTLCITQSLTANLLGLQQGLRADQMLYFPYQRLGSPSPNKRALKRAYLKRVAPHVDPDSLLVGCAMRLRAGKNGDYLLDAFESIREQVPEAVLVIKGDLDSEADYYDCANHTEELKQRLQAPWVIWDRTLSPHEEHLEILQAFDVGVHPTGSDDPPNTICEQLALGTPMLILSGGPRDILFRDAALFIEHQGYHRLRRHWSSFYIPKRDDFATKLLRLIKDASLRQELSNRAPALAQRRFGAEVTRRKLPLLIEGAYHLHHKTTEAPRYRQQILDEWAHDFALFDEPMPQEVQQCVSH
jgi:glycosyltransferase involved in cell wall biosynthesis